MCILFLRVESSSCHVSDDLKACFLCHDTRHESSYAIKSYETGNRIECGGIFEYATNIVMLIIGNIFEKFWSVKKCYFIILIVVNGSLIQKGHRHNSNSSSRSLRRRLISTLNSRRVTHYGVFGDSNLLCINIYFFTTDALELLENREERFPRYW